MSFAQPVCSAIGRRADKQLDEGVQSDVRECPRGMGGRTASQETLTRVHPIPLHTSSSLCLPGDFDTCASHTFPYFFIPLTRMHLSPHDITSDMHRATESYPSVYIPYSFIPLNRRTIEGNRRLTNANACHSRVTSMHAPNCPLHTCSFHPLMFSAISTLASVDLRSEGASYTFVRVCMGSCMGVF